MLRFLVLVVFSLSFNGMNPGPGNLFAADEQTEKEPTQSSSRNQTVSTRGLLPLTLRSRKPLKKSSPFFNIVHEQEVWTANETAIIVCDMWDYHHCLNATLRGKEMAPRMNEVLQHARKQGVTIIHAPSSCLDAYKNHPARLAVKNIPIAKNPPEEIGKWCYKIPSEEKGTYPIDQSDGGEDDDLRKHELWAKELKQLGRNPKAPWRAQTESLKIFPTDFITDQGVETWSILEHRGIENVILVGVHTNMCVLGRPFGLRQMAKNKKHVVLMRDMTDTMYNPKRAPFVSHFTGTDLIIEHIEKYVCPTITSAQLIGGTPFRFQNDRRPHLLILIGEQEYQTNKSLPPFAIEQLGKQFRITTIHADAKDKNSFPGLEVLKDADLLLISVRRRSLPIKQMKLLQQYVAAKKPVMGIRTASHAFSLRGKKPGRGYTTWESFDADVFGGNYHGHHGKGAHVSLKQVPETNQHVVFQGVKMDSFQGFGSLYQVSPINRSAKILLTGSIPNKPAEPMAWFYEREQGGRSFYTSLGHVDDFKQPAFRTMLRNAALHLVNLEPIDEVPPGF